MQEIKTPFGPPIKVWEPGSVVPRRPLARTRWYIAADNKAGKTSLGASIPNGFVLDCEGKMDLVPSAYRNPSLGFASPSNLQEVAAIIDWLVANKRTLPYETVVIDTIDEFLYGEIIPGLTDEYEKKLGNRWKVEDIREYGSSDRGSRGWDIVYGRLRILMKSLWDAGYGWVALGHTREDEVRKIVNGQQMVTMKTRPAVSPGARNQLYRAAEFIGTLNWRTATTTEEQVLVGGEWIPSTPTLIADLTSKSERILKKNNTATKRQCILSVTEKQAESEQKIGSNVSLPPEIILDLGAGWAAVEKAWNSQGPKE